MDIVESDEETETDVALVNGWHCIFNDAPSTRLPMGAGGEMIMEYVYYDFP